MINKFLAVGILTATAAAGLAFSAPASAGDVVSATTIKIPRVGDTEDHHFNVVFRNVKFGCQVHVKLKNNSGKVLTRAADLIDRPSATRKLLLNVPLNGRDETTKVPEGKYTVVASINHCSIHMKKTSQIKIIGH